MIIGICDDEKKCREIIREYCERFASENNENFEYREFQCGEDLTCYEGDIDILLLDVEMGGMDGIETMRKLSECNNVKNILFMSSYRDYVFDSFSDKTRGYIQKAEGYHNFEKYMLSTISQMAERVARRFIKAYINQEYRFIDTDKIIYLSGEGRYVRIFTEKDNYLVCENLSYWEEILSQYDIKRIHNSYLVNFSYVKGLDSKAIELAVGKDKIPIGRKYYEKCKQEYKLYRIRKIRENGK